MNRNPAAVMAVPASAASAASRDLRVRGDPEVFPAPWDPPVFPACPALRARGDLWGPQVLPALRARWALPVLLAPPALRVPWALPVPLVPLVRRGLLAQ